MAHARVEEVSDSDPDEIDISSVVAPRASHPSILNPSEIPYQAPSRAPPRIDPEQAKSWQCLYPLYFDASRSRSEGRRVGKAQAVSNPLARDIVDAVQGLGLSTVFEPAKTHPQDWANPGRVRVLLRQDSTQIAKNTKNKHHLYKLVAEYLKAHPTNENSPLRLQIPGMPPQKGTPPPPSIPKGWKMGTILPLHSAAVTGGGVSDNLFKDMMQTMGGGDSSVPEQKTKKDKKKIKS